MDVNRIKYVIYENKESQLLLSDWEPIIMAFIPFINSSLLALSLLSKNPYYSLVSIAPINTLLSVIDIILIFHVIRRWAKLRNLHFKRQLKLIGFIIGYITELIRRQDTGLNDEVNGLTRFHLDMKDEEGEVNELLYAVGPIILGLFPIIGYIAFLYVYSMLTTDIYLHERREDKLLHKLDKVLVRLGFKPIAYGRRKSIPNRNLILYIILTIITLGLFTIYWSYAINKDISTHIMENPRWESRLLNILESSNHL